MDTLKKLNFIAVLLYVFGIIAMGFWILATKQYNLSSDGTVLLASIGSLFGGLLLIGIAEIIRLLSKIIHSEKGE